MVRVLFILLLLFQAVASVAQTQPLDSNYNFIKGDVESYVGQDIYITPLNDGFTGYWPYVFLLDYTKVETKKSNIYKPDGLSTNYADMAGKYFTILSVIKDPGKPAGNYFLKLKDKASKDIVYYGVKIDDRMLPFTMVAFIEKVTKTCKGKNFMLSKKYVEANTDFRTGKAIKFDKTDKWECIDAKMAKGAAIHYDLFLICQNSKGEQLSIEYVYGYAKSPNGKIFLEDHAKEYISRFGASAWENIILNNVELGMSEEMCALAWGLPREKNRTDTEQSTSVQWVYEGRYLYFTNGKLTTIQ